MTIYKVNNIYPSVQGEGCMTGVPMVIVRLQGCGVGCPWCDTKETWGVEQKHEVVNPDDAFNSDGKQSPKWIRYSASEIAAYVRRTHPGPKWILLTGGEPAEQDLEALVNALHDAGYRVALETSGTALGLLNASLDWVCVSPKIGMPGGRPILHEVMACADEIKHVIGKQADIDKLDALLADCKAVLKESVEICVQPVSQSPKATALCIETCLKRGWRLSVQTHKYLDLP